MTPPARRRSMLPVLLLPLLCVAGCDSMIHQPKKNPWSVKSGDPARPPKNTVEFRDNPAPPPPVSLALVRRGQAEFEQFCTPCHSELGDGHGMVVQRGFSPPPSYHIDRLREAPTQHFFDVITNGYGAMYSFAQRIRPEDRWAIAAYIRALQASREATVADLSPEQRSSLP
jgi:mono/diheme cytochrome c family protein